MKARLTVTDLTRMRGDRVCVGGCLDDGTCVRPVFASDGLREDWLYARGQVVIQPFAVVEFDFHEKVPHPPHTEDRKIDRIYRVRRAMLTPSERRALLLRILDHGVETILGMVQCCLTVRQLRRQRHLRCGRRYCRSEGGRCRWIAQRDQPIARRLRHATQL